MIKKILTLAVFGFILFPQVAMAAQFRASKNGSEIIGQNENVRNLYVAGNSINVDANVASDLVAAGNNVTVNGRVEDDLIAAGSVIILKGPIGANARLASGSVNFDGSTGQDLLVASGTFDSTSTSRVGGDFISSAGTINLNGEINGNVWAAGGNITLNGTINGNVVLKNVTKLKISDTAVINGNLTYNSPNQADIAQGATIRGTTTYSPIKAQDQKGTLGKIFGAITLYSLLASLVTLLIIAYLFPRLISKLVKTSHEKPWLDLAWGLISLIVTPFILMLLFISIIGIKLALIFGLLYLVAIMIASLLAPIFIGAVVLKWIDKKELKVNYLTVIIGVLISFLLSYIPIVGWLINFVFFLIIFGQLLRSLFHLGRTEQQS